MHEMKQPSAGARFRRAVQEESPLQVMGAITAYAGLMAKKTGYKALYLSGGGVAANSLGMPDLGISTMDDVLTDARRIVDATGLPLLVDIDTGWGGAFNIGRTIRSFINVGVAAVHMEDQVGQKRCGHRPGKEVVSTQEMVDRVKSAVDARTDAGRQEVAEERADPVELRRNAVGQRHPRPTEQQLPLVRRDQDVERAGRQRRPDQGGIGARQHGGRVAPIEREPKHQRQDGGARELPGQEHRANSPGPRPS